MDDVDLKMRGEKPLSEEDALDAAIAEAMPMIKFWHEAKARFGADIASAVLQAFADELWAIACDYADNLDVRWEIYGELIKYDLTETVK